MRAKKEFRERDIPLFNERFVNKREMYAYMLGQEQTKELIPRTDRMRNPDGLERFCRTHPYVYLKPIGGSLGMGILAVKRRADHFVTRYRKQGRHRTAKFREARSLYSFVKRYNPDRIYMMQEGIHLMQHEGNPTDFRVHMHKNGSGHWQVAGIGAKIAGKGAVTTHVHNGGHVLSGDEVFRDWYGPEAELMRERVTEVAVRVAQTMEGMLEGPVGEWGLDVGIDESRRIWVFEANAKPGRAIFDHPDLQEAGRRSARFLIEYAAHLARFPVSRGGGSE
nr:YheC/YheD family protein [Tumebacillus amylolyticus]